MMKFSQFFLTKKKPLALILGVSMFFLAAAVSAPSLAWFIEIQDKANTTSMSGVIHGAYFGGSGTSGDPYTIKQPKQIYYFNWLQDIGYFNLANKEGNLEPVYFKLERDIDMTGFVLPPAGTSRFPFVGSFDGDGHTIKNLTITNVYGNLTDPVTNSLDGARMGGTYLKTLNDADCEVVGFFGVVGDYDGELSNDRQTGQTGYLTADGNDYTYHDAINYPTSSNLIKNVAFKNLTVDSATSKTLSGLAAGFVNGTMSGVAVDDSSLSFSGTNQAALTQFTSNLSDYSLVGYAAPAFRGSVEKASMSAIVPTVENPNSAQGGDQWGGSIDMRTMYQNILVTAQNNTTRAQYLTGTRAITNYLNGESEVDDSEVTVNNMAVNQYSKGNGTAYMYYANGTTTDTADSFNQSFSLVKAEEGDTTGGYCGNWKTADEQNSLTLSSDGTGSLNGTSFEWDPVLHTIKGFGMWDLGGNADLLNGSITLSLSDSAKQTASMSINRRFSNYRLTKESETTQWLYLYGKKTTNVSGETFTVKTTQEYAKGVIGNGTSSPYNVLNVAQSGSEYVISNRQNDFDNSTRWTYNDQGHLIADISGRSVYLSNSEGTLTASEDIATVWSYDAEKEQLYSTYGGVKYYLDYSSGWKLIANIAYTIHDDTAGYYLNYASSYTPSAGTDANTATRWLFDGSKYIPSTDTSRYLEYYRGNYGNYPVDIDTSGTPYLLNGSVSSPSGTGYLQSNASGGPYYIKRSGNAWTADTNRNNASTFTISPSTNAWLYYFGNESSKDYTASYTTNDTYFPLTWADSSGGKTVPTEVSDRNTGYVISGANANNGNDIAADIRVSWYEMSNLQNAFNSSSNYSDSLRQRMEVVTNTYVQQENGSYESSGWTLISDDDNKNNTLISSNLTNEFGSAKKDYHSDLKLEKYWTAKKGLKAMFSADNGSRAYGLHFMNAAISTSHKISAPYVKINGKAYKGYELPEDCIDFNLASSGFVNFFAGSYFPGNTTFFSLNEIDRDSNDDITDIHEISGVYLNSDPNTNKDQPYYYTYTGGGHSSTGSQGTMVFNMAWVMSPRMVENALYYFEIPVNSGEYALGSVSGKDGAYLLYLDIGASTTNYKAVTINEVIEGDGQSLAYPLGVDFVDLTSTVFKKDMGLGGLTAAIIIPTSSTGVSHFKYEKYEEDQEGGSLVVAPPTGKTFTGSISPSYVAQNVTAAGFNFASCEGLTHSSTKIERTTSETYDPWTYTVTQQIDSVYTLTGIPGTTVQLHAGGEGTASWSLKTGNSASVDTNGLVTFTGSGVVVINSTLSVTKNNVTEYSGPGAVSGVEGSAGGISYVITNGEASVSWSYDAYTKTYTVRVYSTVGATIAVTKPAEGYTIVITDGTNNTSITSASQTTTVSISANP